jgi:hypothetical protein
MIFAMCYKFKTLNINNSNSNFWMNSYKNIEKVNPELNQLNISTI